MLHAVILAGGSGTRLWPESRKSRPKQFLALHSDRTLIEETVLRARKLVSPNNVWIVTNVEYVTKIKELLPCIGEERILAEPVGRNTAPGIAWVASHILNEDADGTMMVFPADQKIENDDLFCATLNFAAGFVEENPERLVALGVPPTYPATGFGYIERGEEIDGERQTTDGRFLPSLPDCLPSAVCRLYNVAQFREKPHQEVAKRFFESGRFYWNAGISVWKAATILDAIGRFKPEIGKHFIGGVPDNIDDVFAVVESISIDYAVLQNADSLVVVESRFRWNDVGSWSALETLYADDARDSSNNLVVGGVSFFPMESRNCTVWGSNNDTKTKRIVIAGLDDILVVQTADTIYIAPKGRDDLPPKIAAMIDS